ncbi:MAG: hypothetical protein IJX55_10245 [Clostridia bacterium]|nr:hypothetical protein [Clostridia bacterium]
MARGNTRGGAGMRHPRGVSGAGQKAPRRLTEGEPPSQTQTKRATEPRKEAQRGENSFSSAARNAKPPKTAARRGAGRAWAQAERAESLSRLKLDFP